MAERAAKGQEGGHAGLMAAEASSGAGGEHAKPHARSWSESGDGQEQCGDGDDGEMTEALEELILEAYNNMQSDGEFIFLPDHVARKLHEAARLVRPACDRSVGFIILTDRVLLLPAVAIGGRGRDVAGGGAVARADGRRLERERQREQRALAQYGRRRDEDDRQARDVPIGRTCDARSDSTGGW